VQTLKEHAYAIVWVGDALITLNWKTFNKEFSIV
jgi:hypothetical protein